MAHEFGVNLKINKNELELAKAQNITTAQKTTLAGSLVAGDKGLFVYDTDLLKLFVWNGTAFEDVTPAPPQVGRNRGGVTHTGAVPANLVNGDYVIFTSAGTLTNFVAGAVVQIGDLAFYNGSNWDLVQGNVVLATETVAGLIRIATYAEAVSLEDETTAITPASLRAALLGSYYETVLNLVANVKSFIALNPLRTISQITFYRTSSGNYSPIELEWAYNSNTNNIEVTSNIDLVNVLVKVVFATV